MRPPARTLGLVGAASVVAYLPALVVPLFNRDEATIATVARALGEGRLYTVAVDRKPPLVFAWYRLVELTTGTADLRAVRVGLVFSGALTAWLLATEARRHHPRVPVALMGAVVLAALVAFPPEDAQAAGFEIFTLLPLTLAFVASRRGRFASAGLLLGVAALAKQPALFCLPVIVWNVGRRRSWPSAAVTGALAVGALIAVTPLFHPADYVFWVYRGNDSYLALDSLGAVLTRGGAVGAMLMVSHIGLLAGAIHSWRRGHVPLDVTLWFATCLLGALLGFRFFGHYFLTCIPPLALAAAPALADIRWRRFVTVGSVAPAALWVALALHPQWVHPLEPYQRAVDAIDRQTAPGDRIFVWGQFPQLYWRSGRPMGSRFPHVGFVTGITGGRSDEVPYAHPAKGAASLLRRDIERRKPVLILDAAAHAVPRGDQYPLASSPIAGIVRRSYCRVGQVEGITFWRLRGSAEPRTSGGESCARS